MKSIPSTPCQRVALHLHCLAARPANAVFYLRGIAREIPLGDKLQLAIAATFAATLQALAYRLK